LVNIMQTKYLLPVLAALMLSGCASTAPSNDPVRQHVLAELAQAKAAGLVPLSEAQYTYPWPETRVAAVAAVAPADRGH
jgi:outer membrane biogenesis lipoprotein LolB